MRGERSLSPVDDEGGDIRGRVDSRVRTNTNKQCLVKINLTRMYILRVSLPREHSLTNKPIFTTLSGGSLGLWKL